jgi:hypothetical protein
VVILNRGNDWHEPPSTRTEGDACRYDVSHDPYGSASDAEPSAAVEEQEPL